MKLILTLERFALGAPQPNVLLVLGSRPRSMCEDSTK